MKKTIFVFLLAAGFFVLAQNVIAQSNQDFSIANNTGMILVDIFISPSNADNWGPDVIPKDMILDGETFNFTFAGVNPEQCSWDIMFTADTGTQYYMKGVDLCTLTSITLSKQ